MWTRRFWKDAGERVLATAGQVFLLLYGAQQVNVLEMDWRTTAGLVAGGALLSLAKSLAASRRGDPESASLAKGV